MRLHVAALFTQDDDGCLVRVNVPGGAPAPRFFLGRTAEGVTLRFRHDVHPELRQALEAAVASDGLDALDIDAPTDPSRYQEILAGHASVQHVESGPAFSFPRDLPASGGAVHVTEANAAVLQPLLEPWLPDVQLGQPMFAVVVDGHAVSVCCSVRETVEAFEAGVETVPAHRRRGYAPRAVAAWAEAVRAMGRVPLYSTSWENEASRTVARALGLIHFGTDLHIT